eukprot:CAMPEP_0167779094 /NCGR_PEP_ID=MMETSP0111_2-20121227/4622_1 /TAXON_ID=91324 /ORGANISM="Lotharella globosa, Strain CCCM811" /LENGTH=73 /DNA_ID=CAMNT_0007669479 /DNA_START=770 /DNA_END=989 /DNA_ORIENTATION=+
MRVGCELAAPAATPGPADGGLSARKKAFAEKVRRVFDALDNLPALAAILKKIVVQEGKSISNRHPRRTNSARL